MRKPRFRCLRVKVDTTRGEWNRCRLWGRMRLCSAGPGSVAGGAFPLGLGGAFGFPRGDCFLRSGRAFFRRHGFE